ncbi:MAG TPA: DEAD/DEAH box helicase, partial [Microbacterium sp.]|nr:DEAD/DEAH box helicase [Microbacterium sp.]
MDRPTPFPIQAATLPSTLAGMDVLGRGKTGSGKTLAFAIPLVARLSGLRRIPGEPTGLVLAPTRELATQIAASVAPLAKAAGLTVTTVFGGVSQRPQEQAFRAGVDIVVACPGRLEDLISQKIVSLKNVQVTVLDEADHMADLGFLPSVKRLLDQTPQEGQRLLFSATLDNGVDVLVRRYLRDPVTHAVDEVEAPITTPFPIQSATLPDSLAGRDVLGRGRTGSGKTVAFAVPAVAVLASSERRRNRGRPRALILVPTRELAGQVASTVKPLARAMGLRTATVYGGVSQVPQVKALRDGVDIVVACPGRLEDLIGQGHCR